MTGKDFLPRLRERVLLGDGAIGTMFGERGAGRDLPYEQLNLSHPDWVRDLHREYIAAGSELIESNTFGANRTKLRGPDLHQQVSDLNQAGIVLAREAASDQAFVAGSVGPLSHAAGPHEHTPLTDSEIEDVFAEQIVALADAGADVLKFETFTDLRQLLLALKVAREKTDLPVICEMAFHEMGHTQNGIHVLTALEKLTEAGADVVGANCGRGVLCVSRAVQELARNSDLPLSAFPNAGLPEYVDGRYIFGAPMPYLVDSAEKMVATGANLIGGCCGTTPTYIRRLAERLVERRPAIRVPAELPSSRPAVVPSSTTGVSTELAEPLPSNSLLRLPRKPFIVVEIDPPRGLNYEPIVRRAQQLRDMGVDAITMADNPVATLHMGNLALADIVQREADIPVILHMACRDLNLLGLQSRLLEAHVRGVHHILALTGDPAKVGDMPGATSVYDMNSFGLIDLIRRFNSGVNSAGADLGGRTNFTIGVAFNPNGRNLRPLVDRWRRKVEKGAHFAMTQPMYDLTRFEEMTTAVAEIPAPVFVGIMPLLSERNAEFLHNEVPGIVLSDEVRGRMRGLKGKEGRAEGVKLCVELIDAMMPRVAGFYLIPPQRFLDMGVELVSHIRSRMGVGKEHV